MTPRAPSLPDQALRAGAIAFAALLLAGCAGHHAQPPSPAQRGHALAQRACAACHAVEPGRDSPDPKAAAFGSLEMRHVAGLEGRVAELARAGHYAMPPQALTPDEARDVVAYIESLAP